MFQRIAISIHALLAESDIQNARACLDIFISIHALLAESDARHSGPLHGIYHFYPRSPCGERHPSVMQEIAQQRISIHALLAESDCITDGSICLDSNISIHALLAESDVFALLVNGGGLLFLSTLSLRRATIIRHKKKNSTRHFYPRSPCGERPWQRGSRITYVEFLSTLSLRRATYWCRSFWQEKAISIHALLAESDDTSSTQCRL